MPLDVRPLTGPDELPSWLKVVRTAFLEPPTVPAERLAEIVGSFGESRFTGAFEDGGCVGTLRSFPQRVTAVGGGQVAANAVTGVSVAPTHRRRGILSRMMGADLAAAHARGDAVATLISAEYPIYGRFGFEKKDALARLARRRRCDGDRPAARAPARRRAARPRRRGDGPRGGTGAARPVPRRAARRPQQERRGGRALTGTGRRDPG
ncbi:conserved hypothetical protein [Streptomyces sp. SPB78]|nr:conserved hypothetical protein [Streptomyces sp. SPB78]